MTQSKASWLTYIPKLFAAFVAGWLIARVNLPSEREKFAFVIIVVLILFAIVFPWPKLSGETAQRRSARRSLVILGIGLALLTVLAYEIIVAGKLDWLSNHAVWAVPLGALTILIRRWFSRRRGDDLTGR
jgi:hypothetical protein